MNRNRIARHISKSYLFDNLWLNHNGILFWRGSNGNGFNKEQARLILPQVIRKCMELYNSGRRELIEVNYNGDKFYVEVNSSAEVRPHQSYDELQS